MVARIGEGESLQEVAEGAELAVQEVPGVPREAPIPHPAAVEAYFAAEVPAEGASTPGKVVLDDGSIVVFEVTAVTPGDPAGIGEQERMLLGRQLTVLAGNDAAESVLRTLRQQMKVTVVESQL